MLVWEKPSVSTVQLLRPLSRKGRGRALIRGSSCTGRWVKMRCGRGVGMVRVSKGAQTWDGSCVGCQAKGRSGRGGGGLRWGRGCLGVSGMIAVRYLN